MPRKNNTTTYQASLYDNIESQLWATADKLRGHMDPSEYKHVVLGLIFLKYISDAFEERYEQLQLELSDPDSGAYIKEEQARFDTLEDPDEYTRENVFWVPPKARWSHLQGQAKSPAIGKLIDEAMDAIEAANPTLKGVLSKDYNRPTLDKQRLGELVDRIGTIALGDTHAQSQDVLGRVYEYFLARFASAEGKGGGEFYTPRSVVRLLVEMIEPYQGRVYDPCCGSGGMFVQSEKFVEAHGGRLDDISIFGQESNPTTWRLAKMNLAIRGIPANLGRENADTFHRDLHPDLKADYILANPPFNQSDWGGERLRQDVRWRHGAPPVGNANFGWVQHIIHHLAPDGVAGFVLANGSLSSNTSGEGEIRRAIVEADLVDCIVALPPQLFYSTQIPAALWFLARDKSNGRCRSRPGETLFIDARQLGVMISRTQRDLTDDDIARIAGAYHAWRGSVGAVAGAAVRAGFKPAPTAPAPPVQAGLNPAPTAPTTPVQAGLKPAPTAPTTAVRAGFKPAPTASAPPVRAGLKPAPTASAPPVQAGFKPAPTAPTTDAYADVPGFCKAATLADIQAAGYVLTPGRYVGAAEAEADGEPFDQKMRRLVATLDEQFVESARLEQTIRESLGRLGYEQ